MYMVMANMATSLRRPSFSVCSDSGDTAVSSFVWRCLAQRKEATTSSDDDTQAVAHAGEEERANGRTCTSTEETMEECVRLLEPHLDAFRQNNHVDNDTADVPPQLLRVVRFFKWRWHPLKRALLRPPPIVGPPSKTSVEVGSTKLRLALARALHMKGLLSLAEVDGLSRAIDGTNEGVDRGEGTPSKRMKIDHVGDVATLQDDGASLTTRLRLAISRLPSDHANAGSDKAKRGIKYAQTVLAEWKEKRMRGDDNVSFADCPSPEDVVEWCLSAFVATVLANGIGRRGTALRHLQYWKDGDRSTIVESDVELSLASIILDEVGHQGDAESLRVAMDRRISALLSPALIDDLSQIHLLSLARLFLFAPRSDMVVEHLADSIFQCSRQRCGTVGMMPLAKLIASYTSLLGSEEAIEDTMSTLHKSIIEVVESQGVGERGLEQGSGHRPRALFFLDAVFETVRFLLSDLL